MNSTPTPPRFPPVGSRSRKFPAFLAVCIAFAPVAVVASPVTYGWATDGGGGYSLSMTYDDSQRLGHFDPLGNPYAPGTLNLFQRLGVSSDAGPLLTNTGPGNFSEVTSVWTGYVTAAPGWEITDFGFDFYWGYTNPRWSAYKHRLKVTMGGSVWVFDYDWHFTEAGGINRTWLGAPVTAPAGLTILPITIEDYWAASNHPDFGWGTFSVTENYHYINVRARQATNPPPNIPDTGSTALLGLVAGIALLALPRGRPGGCPADRR